MTRFLALLAMALLIASPVMAQSEGAVTPGTVAPRSTLMGCVYNSSPPTATNSQQQAVQCDANGQILISGGGGGGGAVTIADCADTVQGCIADTSASNTLFGWIKKVDADIQAEGSVNVTKIGGTSIVTGGVSGSQGVGGLAASGASVAGNPLLQGCRAATAAPTAVTDGQAIANLCGAEGKQVVLPYTIKEGAVRGAANTTGTGATTIIASAGGSLKNYITSVQCSNTSATTTIVTFNDSATTILVVPAGGGTNVVFPIPLVTAAATAFTFAATTGVTTMYCNAQGYTGL